MRVVRSLPLPIRRRRHLSWGLLWRRPLVVRRFIGSLGEGRGRRRCRIAVGMKIVNEDQNRGVTVGSTGTRTRVTLDHAL